MTKEEKFENAMRDLRKAVKVASDKYRELVKNRARENVNVVNWKILEKREKRSLSDEQM